MPASILEELDHLLGAVSTRRTSTRRTSTRLGCPSRGPARIAQVLGGNGGVPYACTACGHSRS
ncbi:hypothetical protein ACSR0Z_01835 [Streptomyces viridosporus]|uniref:Uncharacterized protein n=1 Tax=Streptomyces viridosporus T7A TaxID=665577 RepID=A0ABX6AF96_STRVD|nr:hypothetical protein [Streptomyces viridosporus]QEU85699.1 hypothetical protein CP969_13980 [Streptomyces viridosporus T7A]